MESASVWAERNFGNVALGDKRRTWRAVRMAEAMAVCPAATVGQQMLSWSAQKAAYRLLDSSAVSHARLSAVHWQHTRTRGNDATQPYLLVQDITEVEYTHHPHTQGLGPIGNHRAQGLEVHTTLLLTPDDGAVLGLAHQHVWVRAAHRPKATRTQRRQQATYQSHVWSRAVSAIGTVPPNCQWIYVADRDSDIFSYFRTIQAQGAHFCIRASRNRCIETDAPAAQQYLLTEARALASQGKYHVTLDDGTVATLAVSWQAVRLKPPQYLQRHAAVLPVWVVRTWEPDPPPSRTHLEWILLTDVPVENVAEACERIKWYTRRWIIEEYHRCLKTGCRLEHSQLRHGDRLQRLLAFVAILAVRLLQLRTVAHQTPEVLARHTLEPVLVQLIALKFRGDPNTLTVGRFWRYVAQLGGFPNRKGDGPPGWLRLWRGWLDLLTLADGVRLAQNLPPLLDVGNP